MCVCVCVCVCTQLLSHVQLCAAPWIVAARLLYPWNFPGKNTEVGWEKFTATNTSIKKEGRSQINHLNFYLREWEKDETRS